MTETLELESVFNLIHTIIETSRHDIMTGDFLVPRDYFVELLRLRHELAEVINKMEEKP